MVEYFVRIFHDSKKHFMPPAKGISGMVSPANNCLPIVCAFLRYVQGKRYCVFFLLEKRDCVFLLRECILFPHHFFYD